MKHYGVIMAGGGGTRFWPLSRQKTPKQLLNLSGNGIMINETIDRISRVIDMSDIYIVTNESQSKKLLATVNEGILENHILKEPLAKNTAACIGYAAIEIIKEYGDGIMCIFPSDHYIKNQKNFDMIMEQAIHIAEKKDKLVTIGVKPTFPSTGYGYINYIKGNDIAFQVNQFVEKPDLKTAKYYLESSNYAWNSGIFIWKASTILENFKRFLPKIYHCLEKLSSVIGTDNEYVKIKQIYEEIPNISIDYGILERSDDVLVILGDIGWNDVGSWDSLGALYDLDMSGNIIKGEQVNIDTKNCICYSENRLIATVGIENLIIVETEDAVLVCRKDQAQKVKEIVEQLRMRGLEYLI